MKYSGHRKPLCELSKLSNSMLSTSSDTKRTLNSLLVYKFRPERTDFNIYAECAQLQLTFLALHSLYINNNKKNIVIWEFPMLLNFNPMFLPRENVIKHFHETREITKRRTEFDGFLAVLLSYQPPIHSWRFR